jgi:hypothetical protein
LCFAIAAISEAIQARGIRFWDQIGELVASDQAGLKSDALLGAEKRSP